MKREAHDLVLMGPPGCGKGTQASRFVSEYGFTQLATGDMLRSEIASGSPLGERAQAIISEGHYMPDEVVEALIDAHAKDAIAAGSPLLFDGFPRTLAQLEWLQGFLESQSRAIRAAFLLEIEPERLVSRLLGRLQCRECGALFHQEVSPPKVEGQCDACGGTLYRRSDDNRETILERLEVYREKTCPVIDRYESLGLLVRVSADDNPENVFSQLSQKLGLSEI